MQYWIQQIAEAIGFIGVGVVVIGVIIMTYKFVMSIGKFEDNSAKVRYGLMRYLELSLDFFVAKDILSLSVNDSDYSSIIRIVIIISVRLVLSLFIHIQSKSEISNKTINRRK